MNIIEHYTPEEEEDKTMPMVVILITCMTRQAEPIGVITLSATEATLRTIGAR